MKETVQGSAIDEFWNTGLHPDSPAAFTESNAANRLLVSARDAFATKGYNGTTTRDIATGANMSPAAMYIHYASKQEMLHKLSMIGHQACLESLRSAIQDDVSPTKQFRAGFYNFAHWHAKHHVIARTIQYELNYLEGDLYASVAEVRRAIQDVFSNIIKQGVIAGDFSTSNIDMTTLAALSMAIDTARWFPSRQMSDPDELAAHYTVLATKMLGETD